MSISSTRPALIADKLLQPAAFSDADGFFFQSIASIGVLTPAPLADSDSIPAPSVGRSGQPVQHVRPGSVTDADSIFAAAIGASLKPALASDSDVIFAASATLTLKPALLAADDNTYAFTTTRFLQPQPVQDADSIPAADVGWRLFANAPVFDADRFFDVAVHTFNGIFADILIEDDVIDTYPFFVHGVEGGIPTPEREHLIGSIRPGNKVLTGSLGQRRVLTGSLSNANRRVLTGSLSTPRYGNTRRGR
jgi:hypothetical protein